MENTPDAAPATATNAEASVASTNNNSNAEAQVSTPQVSEKAQIPADQIEAWNKFMENNGGFSEAFKKVKQAIADPKSVAPQTDPSQAQIQQPNPLNDSITQGPQVVAQQPVKPAEGYLTANDIAKLQYNRMLGEAYPELNAEGYITKGEFVKEATAMGIPVMDQAGNMNDGAIRKFLDLKKAAIPATPAANPVTATPTVQYQEIEGDIDTAEKAQSVMRQGENHPQYEAARKALLKQLYPDMKV